MASSREMSHEDENIKSPVVEQPEGGLQVERRTLGTLIAFIHLRAQVI